MQHFNTTPLGEMQLFRTGEVFREKKKKKKKQKKKKKKKRSRKLLAVIRMLERQC